MANQLVQTVDSTVKDDSLVFCSLPPRKSVWDDQPRLSYYNPNEQHAVPFKWEAAPGKPMAGESQPGSPESPVTRLRPPPGAAAANRRTRRNSIEVLSAEELHRGGYSSRSRSAAPLSTTTLPTQQRSRLPPKNNSGKLQPVPVSLMNAYSGSTPVKSGHRRASNMSNESFSSCGQSDSFDWPEVSDDEYGTPAYDLERRPYDLDRRPAAAMPAAAASKEDFFTSSRSSFSSTSTSSPVTSRSGGSRGSGSARDIMLWRNLVNVAAATAVVTPKPVPVYSGESFSEESEEIDETDHVQPARGFLSCIPLFSRMRLIQSQLSKSESRAPAINFSNRLTPGMKSKVYRR